MLELSGMSEKIEKPIESGESDLSYMWFGPNHGRFGQLGSQEDEPDDTGDPEMSYMWFGPNHGRFGTPDVGSDDPVETDESEMSYMWRGGQGSGLDRIVVGVFKFVVHVIGSGLRGACKAQEQMIEEERRRILRKSYEGRDPYVYDPNDPWF